MRSPEIDSSVADRFPFKNLRLFDDYVWVLGEAVSLCVFSKKSHRIDEEYSDPNQGHLIYEKVVIGEAMEFLRYSHHRVLQTATSRKSSPEEVLADWRTIADTEAVVTSPSNMGEIKDAFVYYEQVLGLADLRVRALQGLEIQRLHASERRTHLFTTLGLVIAGVFGLASVAGIRDSFVAPLLALMGVTTDSSQASELLWLSMATLGVMVVVALGLWFLVNHPWAKRKRPNGK